jgi:hypothetical protein
VHLQDESGVLGFGLSTLSIHQSKAQQPQDNDREDGAVPERRLERTGDGALHDRIELAMQAA